MIGKLVGLAGLAFSLMGGVAIAAEPPTLRAEDFDGIDSLGMTSETVGEVVFSRSNGFTSQLNHEGDLFVLRLFSTLIRSNSGNQLITTIRQADCSGMRQRDLMAQISSDVSTSTITEPSNWSEFTNDSWIGVTCNQAYSDRALASRQSDTPTRVASRFNANARLDGNANIRTGASMNSRIVRNTSQAQAVQVHSYSDDGDWAYITTSTGVVGWTNKVNILQD